MTLDLSLSFGTERLEQETIMVLHRSVNIEIIAQMSHWSALDQAFATEMEIRFDPVYVEPIQDENFYTGHRPSLIDADYDRYPNVAAIANRSTPRGGDGGYDQGEAFDMLLAIEIMCRSEPAASLDDGKREREVNSRTQRTADSVLACLTRNKTLNGTIFALGGTPSIRFSETFAGREAKGSGKRFLWKGSRIEVSAYKII